MFILKILSKYVFIFFIVGITITKSYGNEKQNFKVAVITALNNDLIQLNNFIGENKNSAELIKAGKFIKAYTNFVFKNYSESALNFAEFNSTYPGSVFYTEATILIVESVSKYAPKDMLCKLIDQAQDSLEGPEITNLVYKYFQTKKNTNGCDSGKNIGSPIAFYELNIGKKNKLIKHIEKIFLKNKIQFSSIKNELENMSVTEAENQLNQEEKRRKREALERERKALEEKERKLAEEKARKKRIAEEKARKKKEAAEKARKKKLAEQERKRKLEQDKLARKIKDYKRQAVNFYKDVEEFVKSGGKIDLVKLSELFNVKPDPKKNWNSSDLKTYENLRKFMSSVSEFVTYEKQMIGERLKKSFALKDQSIAQLEKNLDNLKGLMRKMFGSSDTPKITKMISDIESSLANFNQTKANKLIVQTTNYISSKLDKPKVFEKNKETKVIKKASTDQSWLEFQSKLTPQQEQFCKLTESFYKDLNKARKAKNEIMVNRVHKERQINLDGLIPNGKINNWIFRILKIDQVDGGSAAFVLSLQCKSYVGSGQIHTKSTWRKKSNKEWRATVPYNSRRFNELAKLAAGEFVLASGTLLEVNAFKPGQIETFYASQQIGEHPLTKDLNLEGELFLADLSYIAALN